MASVPILMYHGVSENAGPRFAPFVTAPVRFAEHMSYLANHGYCPITVTQFLSAKGADQPAWRGRPVVLTFDDAFQDFYTEALPILRDYGFPATFYVPAALVGDRSLWLGRIGEGDRPLLTWDQVLELQSQGIECGSHSCTHRALDVLPSEMARREIEMSKDILEQRLSRRISTFAYPYGYFNLAVRQMVQEAGYSSACSVKFDLSSYSEDRFALSRLLVRGNTDVAGLQRLLNLPTAPWRALRRVRAQLGLLRRSLTRIPERRRQGREPDEEALASLLPTDLADRPCS